MIATLTDQWGNCGSSVPGGYKDASWYEGGYQQPDPVGIVSYRDFVSEIVSRYKDDPTILAWQLVNEPEVGNCDVVPESTAAADLKAFAADVSGLIKSIDPNHLVSLGTLGTGQCGARESRLSGCDERPDLDLCEYHDYQFGSPMPGDEFNGLKARLDQCGTLGKPLIVGEVGIKPSDVGGTLAALRTHSGASFGRSSTPVSPASWRGRGTRTPRLSTTTTSVRVTPPSRCWERAGPAPLRELSIRCSAAPVW